MNLRQSMKRGTMRPPKTSGGGGGAPYFVNKYQPPDNGAADLIRVIPASIETPRVDFDAKDYVRDENGNIITDPFSYMKYIEYYHAVKNRSVIGSEGPLGAFKGKGDPCVAADWYWYEWRMRQANNSEHPNSIRRSEKYAFTVLVQAPFYKVPRTDNKTGAVLMNQNTNEPYFDWKKGSKRGNDEYAVAGFERKEGHLQHWSLGYAHWNTLTEYTDSLARHCRTCGTQDSIEQVALICQNPDCGDSIVEFDSTGLSHEEIDRLRSDETQCGTCGHVGYLDEIIRCTSCNQGEQATLFDFDLEVKRVKTAGDTGNQTTLQILRAIGPRPIDQQYGEDLRKPLPLEKIFAPTPLEKQTEFFGVVPTPEAAGEGANDAPKRAPTTGGSRSYQR